MATQTVIIVGTPTCAKCKNLKREIEDYHPNVNLIYKDVSELTPQEEHDIMTLGVKSFPVMKLNTMWIVAAPEEFIRLLN